MAGSPVDAKEAIRDPGSARSSRRSTAASWRWTPGEETVFWCGSVTTGTIGAVSPPAPPNSWAMVTFVSQPSLPGTENFWSIALVAELTEAIPTTVRATQKMATTRLCARTQRVRDDIGPPEAERSCEERFVAQTIRRAYSGYCDMRDPMAFDNPPPEPLASAPGFLLSWNGQRTAV